MSGLLFSCPCLSGQCSHFLPQTFWQPTHPSKCKPQLQIHCLLYPPFRTKKKTASTVINKYNLSKLVLHLLKTIVIFFKLQVTCDWGPHQDAVNTIKPWLFFFLHASRMVMEFEHGPSKLHDYHSKCNTEPMMMRFHFRKLDLSHISQLFPATD